MSRCGCSSAGASGAAIADASCITAAGAGTPASPFVLSPKIDPDTRNLLSCGAGGLLAPDPDNPGVWSAYTPAWVSTGAPPSIGSNGVLAGIYRKRGHSLEVMIVLVFGTATIAGTGVYSWGLPAGLVCGFSSPIPFHSYNSTSAAFQSGVALAVQGGNAIGAGVGDGGTVISGAGQGYGSSYYLGGTVYVTT